MVIFQDTYVDLNSLDDVLRVYSYFQGHLLVEDVFNLTKSYLIHSVTQRG